MAFLIILQKNLKAALKQRMLLKKSSFHINLIQTHSLMSKHLNKNWYAVFMLAIIIQPHLPTRERYIHGEVGSLEDLGILTLKSSHNPDFLKNLSVIK